MYSKHFPADNFKTKIQKIKFGMFLYGIQRSTERREKLESLPRPQTPTIRQGLEYK